MIVNVVQTTVCTHASTITKGSFQTEPSSFVLGTR
jgi:hypothetical protein